MKRSQLLVLIVFACLLLATALSAAAVQAAPPSQGESGTARTYWLLLDPSRPAETTLPPLLKSLARLRAAGDVLDYDEAAQAGALRVTAVPGAAVKLRHLPGVAGLSRTAPGAAPTPSGGIHIMAEGVITGVVTDEADGTPLPDIEVCADNDDDIYECVYTESDGTYRIEGLETDSYWVSFYDYDGIYAEEYYNNKPDWDTADLVSVTDGVVTRNINAALSSGGFITGVVTAEGDGTPRPGITVCAESDNADGCADTGDDGTYEISGLGTDSYIVSFNDYTDEYIGEYYNDKPTYETADPVDVTLGEITPNINAALSLPGHITGVVTAASNGALLSGITVCAETDDGQAWEGCATTVDGVYNIDGLGSGNYIVQFVDNGGDYASEYYNDKPDAGTADLVSVTAGQTTQNIDAALTGRGAIAGVVTAEGGGALLGGIEVCAYTNDPDWSGDTPCATTGGDGTYTIDGLDSGSYRVSFRDASASPTYIMEYYDDSPLVWESKSVAVTAGSTTGAVNAALARPGHITGTVRAEQGGTTLPGIRVCAYLGVHEYDEWYCADTKSDGGYDIGGLPRGQYRVEFSDNNHVYAGEYYDNRPTEEEAKGVSVTAGSTTPNINAALAAAGRITGVVTAAGSGEPLFDVEVCAGNDVTDGCARTDSNGTYTISGLSAGSYKVVFDDEDEWGNWGDYARQYYNGRSWETADPVVVTVGHTTPNINAALALGAHITGEVVGVDYLPLEEVDVCAYGSVEPDGYCTTADDDGYYDIGGLPAGTYYVVFYGWGTYYGGECYDDSPCDAPDWITVAAGSTVDDIDAELSDSGHITGSVTAEGSGVPLTDIEVCVDDWNCTLTDGDGLYDLYDGLGAHSYKVEFTDPRGVYAGEFYNDKPNSSSANPVAVVGGGTTPNINAALGAGGHITGSVTILGSGAPLANFKVTVYRSNGAAWDEAGVAYTDSTGRYSIALPSGTYRVKFEDWWWGEYEARYYRNGATPGGVTAISLAAPSTVPNINVTFGTAVEPGPKVYLPIIRK